MVEEKTVELITKLVLKSLEEQQESGSGFLVPVGVSARHVHLTQEDVETLFGPGHTLHKKKELMGGQFAAEECVTIVGLKLRAIENVRVLGPCRKKIAGRNIRNRRAEARCQSADPRIRQHCRKRSDRVSGAAGRHLYKGRLHHRKTPHSYVAQGCRSGRRKGW